MVGDGGFLMNGAQELGTCIANGIDLTILVLNDNAYGMIKWKQARRCTSATCSHDAAQLAVSAPARAKCYCLD